MLESIELENIRSYERERIEFPRGITLFEGDIGSGKSSVLMGIEFALFGLGSQKPEALLSKKANEGVVTLNFEANGQKCEIRRTLRRKGESVSQDPKSSYLKVGDVLEPLSPSELKQRVLQILRFNESEDPRSESRIFRYAVFTPQEEMKEILRDPSKRLETIRKAFRVEDYKTAIENSENFRRFLDKQAGILGERFHDLPRHEEELGRTKKSLEDCAIITGRLEKEKARLERQLAEIRLKVEQARKDREKSVRLSAEIKNAQAQASNREMEIAKISRELEDAISEISRTEKEIASLKEVTRPATTNLERVNCLIKEFSESNKAKHELASKIEVLSRQSAVLEREIGQHALAGADDLETRLDGLLAEIASLQSGLESTDGQIVECSKLLTKYETNVEEYTRDLGQIRSLDSKCPVCESNISHEHKERVERDREARLEEAASKIGGISEEISSLQSRRVTLKARISEKELERDMIRKIIPALKKASENAVEMQAARIGLERLEEVAINLEEEIGPGDGKEDPVERLATVKEALLRYQNACDRIKEKEVQKAKLAQTMDCRKMEIESSRLEMGRLCDEIQKMKSEIGQLEGLEARTESLEREEAACQRMLGEASQDLARQEQTRTSLEDKKSGHENSIAEALYWQKWYRRYSNFHEWLSKFFIPTLEQIERQVLLAIQQDFNEAYRHWYSILIDDPTKESRIDESFTPIVEQDGYEQDVEFLSGGEKTSIALAYRLTLNSLIRRGSSTMNTNLLILDEPTDGFSKTQLAKVKSLLMEMNSEQIILVSHEKELETYVDNIFQVSKDSGISKITRMTGRP